MNAKWVSGVLCVGIIIAATVSTAGAQATVCPSNSSKSNASAVVDLEIDDSDVASSIWGNGTVSLAIQVENLGNTTASGVSIQSVQGPPSSSYLGPTPLPYAAGDILPDDAGQLNAQ